jgi:hypothetical protein
VISTIPRQTNIWREFAGTNSTSGEVRRQERDRADTVAIARQRRGRARRESTVLEIAA